MKSGMVESFNTMVEGLEERDHIRNSFGRYVDPGFCQDPDGAPGGRPAGGGPAEAVMLMSDIRGFTNMSETF